MFVIGVELYIDEQWKKIECMFGVKVYNSFGMIEMNGLGVVFECIEQNGMYFWEDCYYVEIINFEIGEFVFEGEIGEFVFIIFDCEMMLLICYCICDFICILLGNCFCGCIYIWIDCIKGCSDDMFIIKGVNIFFM